MVLGKLPVPWRPTNLENSRARAYCACSRCGGVVWTYFSLVYHFSLLSPSFWGTAQYRLKCCLKGPLSPTNQPTNKSYDAMVTGYNFNFKHEFESSKDTLGCYMNNINLCIKFRP